jgi:hypothetical protein
VRLDHLCDLELAYRDDDDFLDEGFDLVRPYGTEEGTGYGEGDGRASGDRLRGTIRWSNLPHRRSDAVFMPNLNGSIHSDDGAVVLLTIRGHAVPPVGEEGVRRQILARIGLEAEAEAYRWMNRSFFVAEGMIELATGKIHLAVYECINELV